jgi:peroxiredoxin/predicted 2-oxoglutarate/Fe(II)-dependent dioxygenase YbiX
MPDINLQVGEPAPWFEARSPVNPSFHFDTVAGRYIVLCFFGSANDSASRRVLDDILQHRSVFDDKNACFFGVSIDPEDERSGRVREMQPGLHVFWDFDRNVSSLFGAAVAQTAGAQTGGDLGAESYRRFSVVLDERLRVFALVPLDDQPEQHVPRVLQALSALPPLEPARMAGVPAPILIVPRVFEPELCRTLIRYYEERGGEESGFMRDIDGKTVAVHDYGHKRRRDQEIADEPLRKACMVRIHDRLVPEIHKAFQFRATRIERYIVACYEAETAGHFRAHRDNTTKGTAHRRFAVSLVLNTGEFEGGNLRFPEFGRQLYCPPAGGAVVFSCSLLHEATPVTHGKRYVFLPFLYDDAAARVRKENQRFIGGTESSPGPGSVPKNEDEGK